MSLMLRACDGVSQRVVPRADPPAYDAEVQAAIETALRGHWKRLYLHAMRDDLAAAQSRSDPWKHACPQFTPALQSAGVRTILMVRDPYSWLVGLARRPYHLKGPNADTLEGFAARPWMTERREGLPAVLASPLALWSAKARATLQYAGAARAAGCPAVILRFEDLVQDARGTAARAFLALGLQVTGDIAPPEKNTKSGEASAASLRAYYGAERWAARLSRETVCRINARVDWAAASALGYARRAEDSFPETLPAEILARQQAEMSGLGVPSHREAGAAAAT